MGWMGCQGDQLRDACSCEKQLDGEVLRERWLGRVMEGLVVAWEGGRDEMYPLND